MDLPHTYTDPNGTRLTISSDGLIGLTAPGQGTIYAEAPTGEDAFALARTVLANPGPGDVRYVVVPEWQVIDPAELAAEKRAYAEASARSMRDRAARTVMSYTDGLDDLAGEVEDLPLLPDEPARTPLTADTDT